MKICKCDVCKKDVSWACLHDIVKEMKTLKVKEVCYECYVKIEDVRKTLRDKYYITINADMREYIGQLEAK